MAGRPLLGWELWNGKGGLQGRGEGDRANGEGLGHGEGTGPLCPVDNSPSTQQEACGAVLSEARASSPGPQAAQIPPPTVSKQRRGCFLLSSLLPGPPALGDSVTQSRASRQPPQCLHVQGSAERNSHGPALPGEATLPLLLPSQQRPPPAPRSSWDPQYLWQGAGRASPLSAVPRGRPGRVAGGRWTWLGAALQGKVP